MLGLLFLPWLAMAAVFIPRPYGESAVAREARFRAEHGRPSSILDRTQWPQFNERTR